MLMLGKKKDGEHNKLSIYCKRLEMSLFTANHRRNGVRCAESESIVEFWKLSLSSWLAWVLAVCICVMENRGKSLK